MGKMNQLCDFCREQRSMIYCSSDAAYLCLSCDRSVHSANALSKRHMRGLICERCNSQTAVVRCIEEKLSLCQNCNWSGHDPRTSATEHKRQMISSYSGCPSAAELSKIWAFFYFDLSISDPEAGSLIIVEGDKSISQCPLTLVDCSPQESDVDPMDSDVKQVQGIESLKSLNQKASSLRIKRIESIHEDLLYQDLDISDIDCSFENCEALFGETIDGPRQFFDDGGFDNLFETGNLHGTECSEESVYEQPCSNAVSVDSLTSNKADPICFPIPEQSRRSGLTGECSTGAHHGCSVSSMVILIEEHPYNVHCPENLLPSAIRDCAVLRYREKKKSRKFDKKIRYASRKAGADVRKRVNGRFVKADDPFVYDPLDLASECTFSKVYLERHVVQ